jgi:AAA domain
MITTAKLILPSEAIKRLEQVAERAVMQSPFVDIAPYLDGDCELVKPTVGNVLPERCLFYAGAINEVHGEPSVGKTNILLAAAGTVLANGGKVFFLDPEDSPARIIPRALSLGIDREAMRTGFFYMQDPTPDDYAVAHEWARREQPELVILDGLAEALAREGHDENTPADVLSFFQDRIRPFADAGCAAVVADHVAKSSETRGRWARGSGAKMGRYNGASYEIVLGESYTPTKPGHVRLKVSKDRNGGVGAIGKTVFELHFSPRDFGGTEARWELAPDEFRPTCLMSKVLEQLKTYGSATKRELRDLGGHTGVDKAIQLLMKEGSIIREVSGHKHVFRLAAAEGDERA